jgi:hypothetical protein
MKTESTGRDRVASLLATLLIVARRASVAIAMVIICVLSAKLAQEQMRSTHMLVEPRVRLEYYLNGTVARPFAYRALVPMLLRPCLWVPDGRRRALERRLRTIEEKVLPPEFPSPPQSLPYDVLFCTLTVSLLIYAWITGEAYARAFIVAPWFRLAPHILALVAVVPILSEGFAHIYDFAVLAISAGLLYALIASNQPLFFAFFFIGCLNKETTLIFSLAYLFCFWGRLPPKRLASFLALQCLVFLLCQAAIRVMFRDNPGVFMERNYRLHLDWMVSRSLADLIGALVVCWLFLKGFHGRPRVLRQASVMLFPIAALYILAGYPGEFRVFYDALPLLVLMACRNIELWLAHALRLPLVTDPDAPVSARSASAMATGEP